MVSPSKRDDFYNINELSDFESESSVKKQNFLGYIDQFKSCIEKSDIPKIEKLKNRLFEVKDDEESHEYIGKFIKKIEAYLHDAQHEKVSSGSSQSLRSESILGASIHEKPLMSGLTEEEKFQDDLRELYSLYDDLPDPTDSGIVKKDKNNLLELKEKLRTLIKKHQDNERLKNLDSLVQDYESEVRANEVREIKDGYKKCVDEFNKKFKNAAEDGEVPNYDDVVKLNNNVRNLLERIDDLQDKSKVRELISTLKVIEESFSAFFIDSPSDLDSGVQQFPTFAPAPLVFEKVEVMPRSSAPVNVNAQFEKCNLEIDKLIDRFDKSKTNKELDQVKEELKSCEDKLKTMDSDMLNEENFDLWKERQFLFTGGEGFGSIYRQFDFKKAVIAQKQALDQQKETLLEDKFYNILKRDVFPKGMPNDYDKMVKKINSPEIFIGSIKDACPHWKNLGPDEIRVKMNELLARKVDVKEKYTVMPSPNFTKTLDMTTSLSALVEKREQIKKEIEKKSKDRRNDQVISLTTQLVQVIERIEKREALLRSNVANAIALFITLEDKEYETIQYTQISFLDHSPEQQNMSKDQEWVFQALNGKALVFDGGKGVDEDGNMHLSPQKVGRDGVPLRVMCETRYFRFDENNRLDKEEEDLTPAQILWREESRGAKIGIGGPGKGAAKLISLFKKFKQ